MQLAFAFLLTVTLATLPFTVSKVQYDDDSTPRQVHLEDLENEHDQRQQLQLQQRPSLGAAQQNNQQRPPAIQRQPPFSYYNHKQIVFKDSLEQPKRPAVADYDSISANRYSVNDLSGRGNTDDVEDLDDVRENSHDESVESQQYYQQQQQQQHDNQPSSGYALMENSGAFVLVPPFDEANTVNGVSDERNYEHNTYLRVHKQQVSPYVSNEAASTLQYAPAGVHYLTSNELSEGTKKYAQRPNFGEELYRRPAIEYGSPDLTLRRPLYPQSNQLAYAPKRIEAGSLSHSAVNIPYPPSFISITTGRPETYSHPVGVPPLGREFYARQFKPSPVDPLPDIFHQRQSKSLLDSYIPSWVVAKMMQQHSGRIGFNNLIYTSASPYSRHFKRQAIEKVKPKEEEKKEEIKQHQD